MNVTNRKPVTADYHVLYQVAHHDVWQAKSQQWSVANWTLALIAALVGIAKLIYQPSELVVSNTWWLTSLDVLVSVGSGWYLRRLQGQVLHNRRVYRKLEEATGLGAAKAEVDASPPDLPDDAKRGREFPSAMAIAIGAASGLAGYIFGLSICAASLGAVILGLVNVLFVCDAT